MGVLYFSLNANFQTCTSIQDRIDKIDAIIDELLNNIALKSVSTANMVEYRIDTGQTVQQVTYSSSTQVTDTIRAYETMRQFYVNKLLGNKWKVIGDKNLKRRGC